MKTNLVRDTLIYGLAATAVIAAGVIITVRTIGEVLIIAAKMAWPWALRLAHYVGELRGEAPIVTTQEA